jgi:hypothetical protein
MLNLSEETLASWEKEFIPEKDLFFFQSIEEVLNLMPKEVLVMPIEEFFSHRAYSTIDYVNAYWYWNISKTINFVCILPPNIFPTISDEKKKKILAFQQQSGRGLIFETVEIDTILEQLPGHEQYTFVLNGVSYMAFQRDMWIKLPSNLKREFLIAFSKEFIDEVYEMSQEELKHLEPQILPLVNRFPERGGGNCFAAVLASITLDRDLSAWIAREWVAQETLLTALELRNYQVTSVTLDSLKPKDVLLWRNSQETIIHGVFYLGNGLVFNKNGQQFFNPWQVLKIEVLMKIWGENQLEIWRRF